MYMTSLCYVLLTLIPLASCWDYCIIGAGPGGVQVAYYLHQAKQNYVVLERNAIPGSFFQQYPRSRTLISINKRYTGESNSEFNMRHDWNSLLSDDPTMVFKHYSKEMFPPADKFLDYMLEYTTRFNLNIHYNTTVQRVYQGFVIVTKERDYPCKRIISSTGLSTLYKIKAPGGELVEGYDTVSHNPDDYEGLKVLILGKGNSGFETADMMVGSTGFVHLMSRSRVKLSWNTHYVGDLRGVNNQILDTYQLKSLDALMEADADQGMMYKKVKGQLYAVKEGSQDMDVDVEHDHGPYDKIINCLGFQFDQDIYNVSVAQDANSKYPDIGWDFQSLNIDNLYFAGTITHGLDKRVSSGGFIHGFRYTAKALARILLAQHEKIRWPSTSIPLERVVSVFGKRLNEMSGPYQMFNVMVDVWVKMGETVELFTEVPIGMLHKLHEMLLQPSSTPINMVVVRLEYGNNFSRADGDPFKEDRVQLDPALAHSCNFIHPVLYHYKQLPGPVPVRGKTLTRYSKKLHLVEDLYTDFSTLSAHHAPILAFLGTAFKVDLQSYSAERCAVLELTQRKSPVTCRSIRYQGGKGNSRTPSTKTTLQSILQTIAI